MVVAYSGKQSAYEAGDVILVNDSFPFINITFDYFYCLTVTYHKQHNRRSVQVFVLIQGKRMRKFILFV